MYLIWKLSFVGIINSFNLSPSQSSAFYSSSLYMPHISLLGPSSPTVIMNIPGNGFELTKKSLEDNSGVDHSASSIDCGRNINDQVDSNALGLMDLPDYAKNDLPSSSSSLMFSSPLIALQSSESQSALTQPTTVLPPVSTFLLPNFRDQGWWDRLERLKSNTKDTSDCECYDMEQQREYSNRSNSPSTLTSLPASLSN